MNNIILESQVQDILLDFAEFVDTNNDLTQGDIQGIAQAKARDIIELIKKELIK
jgi:hypothetical protein